MMIVIATHIPPAVRGRMKLWFIEPLPNIFVSGVKDSVANKVADYLYDHCPYTSGLTIIQRINVAPGFKIRTKGMPGKTVIGISGHQLIREKESPDIYQA